MTVAQLIADLDELVDHVRRRLGKERVAILGHSWGSALGVLYAARFAGKVAVYAGVAQVGDWAASEVASYEKAVAEAERQGKRAVTAQLARARALLVERRSALEALARKLLEQETLDGSEVRRVLEDHPARTAARPLGEVAASR
jgi:pimeloyl-ACP methyl ester carboxylesterase